MDSPLDTQAGLLAALRLQIEWGADEALLDAPLNRSAPPRLPVQPGAAASPAPIEPGGVVARAAAAAAVADSPAALRAALAAFDGCPLAVTATSLVFADGNPAAGLVIVGDCPGAEEDRAGRPFTGPAGQFLDRMLASIGIDRSACLMTMLVPWRPPGDRPASPTEIAVCLPFLQRHLALLRPRRVLMFGQTTARALTGSTASIAQLRGRWHRLQLPGLAVRLPALPMQSPAVIQGRPDAKRTAWTDLCALRRALDSPADPE